MPTTLIIDDNQEVLEILELCLSRKQLNVVKAWNTPSFEAALQKNTIDLILLDVVLQDADGRELCKSLKARPEFRNTPVVLMSCTPAMVSDYKACQADDKLHKPFGLDELNAVVEKYLIN